ncbi:MAG: isoprenylcysteine carboxylmethyltransferase family protein [Bryobacteraceae bacterium]
MLWIRGLLFTLLMPCLGGGLAPYLLSGSRPLQPGWWRIGWVPLSLGGAVYLSCLLNFLAAKGTPAPFFMRRMHSIIGEEPGSLVCAGLYKFTRNPMYVGVLLVIFGQALLFASAAIALYGLAAWLFFHLVVVRVEEPHLRAKQGAGYDDYCRRVPRWLGLPK